MKQPSIGRGAWVVIGVVLFVAVSMCNSLMRPVTYQSTGPAPGVTLPPYESPTVSAPPPQSITDAPRGTFAPAPIDYATRQGPPLPAQMQSPPMECERRGSPTLRKNLMDGVRRALADAQASPAASGMPVRLIFAHASRTFPTAVCGQIYFDAFGGGWRFVVMNGVVSGKWQDIRAVDQLAPTYCQAEPDTCLSWDNNQWRAPSKPEAPEPLPKTALAQPDPQASAMAWIGMGLAQRRATAAWFLRAQRRSDDDRAVDELAACMSSAAEVGVVNRSAQDLALACAQ